MIFIPLINPVIPDRSNLPDYQQQKIRS